MELTGWTDGRTGRGSQGREGTPGEGERWRERQQQEG